MRIKVVSEAEALPLGPDAASLGAAGGRMILRPLAHVPAEEGRKLTARAGGAPTPSWFDGLVLTVGETSVCLVTDAFQLPGYGAVVDAHGRAFAATVGGLQTKWPGLSGLPGFSTDDQGLAFEPPAAVPHLDAVAAFQPWGGAFNYGHFLLDGLSSLLALEEAGLLADHIPVSAPLAAWGRDLLAYGFPGLSVREIRAPVVRANSVAFATSMDHFLGKPNGLAVGVRDRILAHAPARRGARRLYLSRRGQPMRVMVNEAALEAALRSRGFTIVRPEALSPAEQIALARDAEVIVAPTGAALANALFAPSGARIVEIAPQNYASHWVLALCRLTGAEWRPFYCASPCPPAEIPLLKRLRSYVFGYRLPLEPFLAYLDPLL
jgi:capsular polysaccharide biosynthesis protein